MSTQFTDAEIETIKEIISEHGSDCPGTDYNKVEELRYKLGLSVRPTAEEIAERERRGKEFDDSLFSRYARELLIYEKEHINKLAIIIHKDNVFFNDFTGPIKSNLRIKLPNDYKANLND